MDGELIDLLRPYHVPGVFRQRFPVYGGDGGYVVPVRQVIDSEAVYCLGASEHCPFEETIARQLPNKPFHLFDMEEPQNQWWKGVSNVQFHLRQFGRGGTNLTDVLESQGDHGKRITFKLDVEGVEWDIFETVDDFTLECMEVIAGEFHSLDDATQEERHCAVLERLNRSFTLIHIHGNNCGTTFGPFAFPSVVELTYIHNRHAAGRLLSTESFPTPIDWPNNPRAADYPILFEV